MASGTPNKAYNDYWNYDRDYESTKDKYFTKEEQDLIINCLRSHEEEAAYLSEKTCMDGKIRRILCARLQRRSVSGGTSTSARVLAQGLSKEIFQQTVTEKLTGKLERRTEEAGR